MNWFERITGFPERDYKLTQSLLQIVDGQLVSAHSERHWGVGRFETPTLAQLREHVGSASHEDAKQTSFRALTGNAQALHCDPANANALFQVASQFNALEMSNPSVTPEQGVSRYANDATQGPACAIAAGAATIYRNYLVPLAGGMGQTADRQIDTLSELSAALEDRPGELWDMRNGYALCTSAGLDRLDRLLAALEDAERYRLLGQLRIGLHWDVEVTLTQMPLTVSQAFCSALPCSYSSIPRARWERFARLVLEAAYEATLLAGILNMRRTGCPVVYLTRPGGGAFGNADAWIFDAITKALGLHALSGLDVRLVSFGQVPKEYLDLESTWMTAD